MAIADEQSLMRRTKAELVQIILRKDATEIKQNEEVSKLKNEVSNKTTRITELETQISDYEAELDMNSTDKQSLTDLAYEWKVTAISSLIVNVALMIAVIVSFCVR